MEHTHTANSNIIFVIFTNSMSVTEITRGGKI